LFTDADVALFGQHDYFVTAEDVTGAVSEPSNMVSYPSKNQPVTFLSMTKALRKWNASTDLRFSLFLARSSVRNGDFAAARSQLHNMIQAAFWDPSMTPWFAQDAGILLSKLARRVTLAELGVLSTNNVLWGFQFDLTPSLTSSRTLRRWRTRSPN
jgi:hypothetical protein